METKTPITREQMAEIFKNHAGRVPTDEVHLAMISECSLFTKFRAFQMDQFHWHALQASGKIIVDPAQDVTRPEVYIYIPESNKVVCWFRIFMKNGHLLIISGNLDDGERPFWHYMVAGAFTHAFDESLVEALIKYGFCWDQEEVHEAISTLMYG